MEKVNKWIRVGIIVTAGILLFMVTLSFGLDVYYGWFRETDEIAEEWTVSDYGIYKSLEDERP